MEKARKELVGKDKNAYFVCFICLYKNENDYKFFEGKSYGYIIDEERGSTEFGYDSIFYSTELNKTFGEATSELFNDYIDKWFDDLFESIIKELDNGKVVIVAGFQGINENMDITCLSLLLSLLIRCRYLLALGESLYTQEVRFLMGSP